MKKIFTLFVMLMLMMVSVWAQVPQKMSYQAVVRNSNNQLVTNQQVSVRITILQGSVSGTPVYVERHTTTTNVNGLMTVEVGDGIVESGDMSTIDWGGEIGRAHV